MISLVQDEEEAAWYRARRHVRLQQEFVQQVGDRRVLRDNLILTLTMQPVVAVPLKFFEGVFVTAKRKQMFLPILDSLFGRALGHDHLDELLGVQQEQQVEMVLHDRWELD